MRYSKACDKRTPSGTVFWLSWGQSFVSFRCKCPFISDQVNLNNTILFLVTVLCSQSLLLTSVLVVGFTVVLWLEDCLRKLAHIFYKQNLASSPKYKPKKDNSSPLQLSIRHTCLWFCLGVFFSGKCFFFFTN